MDSSVTAPLYRDITDFAHDMPSWVQHLAEIWTELGLLVFGALFITGWWRARNQDDGALALAVLAPVATAFGYVASEVLKSVVDEERPCRSVAGAAASLVTCPPTGDWSFPSNHSAIAGAAAVALAIARPRLAWLTVPLALLMAFSRVFVGVHYPHDVAVGLLLGAAVSALVVAILRRPAQSLARTVRGSGAPVAAWASGPGGRAGGRAPPRAPRPGHAPPGPAPPPAGAGRGPVMTPLNNT
ncbi:phosphatase PAP2 family protein, partial [Streptomyces gelaticus]